MPAVMQLPVRSNAEVYTQDEAQEVYDLLSELAKGQAVAVEDNPQPTETKARYRAKRMGETINQYIDADITLRVHVIPQGDTEFYGALSIKPAKPAKDETSKAK